MSLASSAPLFGYQPGRKSIARLLMVCWFDPTGINTVRENIVVWQRFSRFDIEILNLWPGRGGLLTIPSTVDLGDYGGIIVHCAVSYSLANLRALDRALVRPFEHYDGVKILMKQDEQRQTGSFARYIADKKFDIVVTCVPASEQSKVYPSEVVGDVQFLHALTGYVSPMLRSIDNLPQAERRIDIAYRGSPQPLEFGRLGYEKRKIGDDVARAMECRGLKLDISSRPEDRVLGPAWFDFLARSKAVLGAESGSNLFDFTGEVETWCRNFERQHAIPFCEHTDRQYEKAHVEYLHRFEGNVAYGQISPRHFEAVATRSLQVLYDGNYSGVLTAQRHFVPLRRDVSNLLEIIEILTDERHCARLTECAYEDVIQNPKYWYEGFITRFDDAAERALAGKETRCQRRRTSASLRPRVLMLMAHEPVADPRIDWFASSLAADFDVCELGTYAKEGAGPSAERIADHRFRFRIERERLDWDWVPGGSAEHGAVSAGLQCLLRLYLLAELPSRSLMRVLGAFDAEEQDLARFRWLVRYFVMTNGALVQAGRLIGEFDVIVAADLETLPAALALGSESGARVVYDAHEWWPHADIDFRHWEVEFWTAIDRELSQCAALRVTVSPQLALLMSQEYGCEFVLAPNCATLEDGDGIDLDAVLAARAGHKEVIFLFQGLFAPGRGLEDLITAWAETDQHAILWLRGPESPYKISLIKQAQRLGLLGARIVFLPAVAEAMLIQAAREADIGIIPYSPANINYRLACPNKLSQYMAAGLPILCSEIEYVRQVVRENNTGLTVDFGNHSALARTVNDLAASRLRIAEMSRNSREAFLSRFNWQAAGRTAVERIRALLGIRPVPSRDEPDFSWIETGREMVTAMADLGSAITIFPQARLIAEAEIRRLNEVYPAEIRRLNEVYPAEIRRLNEVYPAEIRRLNEVYPAEIRRLNEVYPAEIRRLNEVYSAEISRLHEVYSAEIVRLNETYQRVIAKPNRLFHRWLVGPAVLDRLSRNGVFRAAWRGLPFRLRQRVNELTRRG
jgi:glycosyltransferase involved in cell wall biosynthesis